ncbi:MAG: hypothetical protein ACFCUI_07685 [Bernardetiaceae bacterium]
MSTTYDPLKKLMQNASLDHETAPEQAWQQIAQRLDAHHQAQRQQWWWTQTRRMAASLLILVLFILGANQWANQQQAQQIAQQYPELIETERFYEQVIAQKKSALHQADTALYQTELNLLRKDYEDLREALGEQTNNQQIIHSMIQNYRLRVQLLEELIQMLDTNPLHHEDSTQTHAPRS